MAKKIETANIAKTLNASPKAPKGKAPAKGKAPKAEEKVRKAWNAGKAVVHHAVRVGKESFTSTWMAFQGIKELKGLSRGQHIKFRKNLKLAKGGRLDYVHPESGKVYPFTLIQE